MHGENMKSVKFVFKDIFRTSQRAKFVSTKRTPSWCSTH